MDLRLKEILNLRIEFSPLKQISLQRWITSIFLLSCFAIYPILIGDLLWQSALLRLGFGVVVVSLALIWPHQQKYLVIFLSVGAVGYLLGQAAIWAWLLTILASTFFIVLVAKIQHRLLLSQLRWLKGVRVGIWIGSSILISFLLAALSELETNFSEEEFFVALTAVSFSVGWLLIAGAYQSLQPFKQKLGSPEINIRRVYFFLGGIAGLGLTIFGLITASRYQSSFYSSEAPHYPGISDQMPFLCSQIPPNSDTPSAKQVYVEILAQIVANPYKRAPEYGMLALGTRQKKWAEQFRESILEEARSNEFLGSAGSVKFFQYEAALRAYYLNGVIAIFPELFSEAELNTLKAWFVDINKHTLSIGWVDFLYALAFSKWPEGPYENQENGAGLLAQLELNGYADPASSWDNHDYLRRNVRGWSTRFKNTDDTYLYQREWTNNALFQAQFGEVIQPVNAPSKELKNLSFEWSLLQAVPDGFPLTYNHPYRVNFAGYFYLGAIFTGDPRYVWLADRALASFRNGNFALLFAQPGADKVIDIIGKSPTAGSCLLFSHAGLPNQRGPLAPDKMVLRSGWNLESAYLLLNLRFAGWHRYKATNAITLFYKESPIVIENVGIASYDWLPQGRRILRDKRIPRENLNGLLIPRQGINAVIHQLTGLGGPWTQDPPHYASVKSFATLAGLDVGRTIIEDWHSWQHERNIFFFHEGPLIVTDQAAASGGRGKSAISWNLVGELVSHDNTEGSLLLDNGKNLTRVVLSVKDEGNLSANSEPSSVYWLPDQTIWNLIYHSNKEGQLSLTTLFLSDEWLIAEPVIETIYASGSMEPIGTYVTLENDAQRVSLWQNHSSLPLTKAGVTIEGYALSILQHKIQNNTTFCVIDATRVKVEREQEPREVTIMHTEAQRIEQPEWHWENGILTIALSPASSICLKIEG